MKEQAKPKPPCDCEWEKIAKQIKCDNQEEDDD